MAVKRKCNMAGMSMGKKKFFSKKKSGNDPHKGKGPMPKKIMEQMAKNKANASKIKGYDPHATMDKQRKTAKMKSGKDPHA